ncbi:hypothetical protein POX_a00157 [Penicillium oxalicum]|uniref:hypothetical protein n=1 Tax=Penicillium oxalicum TaxID=69781 RepID=UPI0020B8B1B6|nr:hypothetical protein POX_a00157 [Penicillium oxalicum]KAI2793576.1 hypothetical protein POX_a00157 [Penicillium oxalicum]
MAARSHPSTPRAGPFTAPAATPASEGGTPGKWRHPQLSEVVRRQNAANFSDKNFRSVIWNGSTLLFTWVFGGTLKSYARRVFDSKPAYCELPLLLLQGLLLFNILLALYPLFRPKDNLSDISLTPTQRALLGLDPSVAPPPRGAHIASRRSGSPVSSASTFTERRGSSGTSFSPASSPLFTKTTNAGSLESSHRLSVGSSSPLARSNSFGESTMSNMSSISGMSVMSGMSSIGPSTPSPLAGKRRSLGVSNKWLYERSRRLSTSNSAL